MSRAFTTASVSSLRDRRAPRPRPVPRRRCRRRCRRRPGRRRRPPIPARQPVGAEALDQGAVPDQILRQPATPPGHVRRRSPRPTTSPAALGPPPPCGPMQRSIVDLQQRFLPAPPDTRSGPGQRPRPSVGDPAGHPVPLLRRVRHRLDGGQLTGRHQQPRSGQLALPEPPGTPPPSTRTGWRRSSGAAGTSSLSSRPAGAAGHATITASAVSSSPSGPTRPNPSRSRRRPRASRRCGCPHRRGRQLADQASTPADRRHRPDRRTPVRRPVAGARWRGRSRDPPARARANSSCATAANDSSPRPAGVHPAQQRLQQPIGHLRPESLLDVVARSRRRRSTAGRAAPVPAGRRSTRRRTAVRPAPSRSVGTPSTDGGSRCGRPPTKQPGLGRRSDAPARAEPELVASARPPPAAGPASIPRRRRRRPVEPTVASLPPQRGDPSRRHLAAAQRQPARRRQASDPAADHGDVGHATLRPPRSSAPSACTRSTIRASTSGSVSGGTPWPRLKTCPGAAAPERDHRPGPLGQHRPRSPEQRGIEVALHRVPTPEPSVRLGERQPPVDPDHVGSGRAHQAAAAPRCRRRSGSAARRADRPLQHRRRVGLDVRRVVRRAAGCPPRSRTAARARPRRRPAASRNVARDLGEAGAELVPQRRRTTISALVRA